MPEDSSIIAEIIIAREDKDELIRELGLLDVSHRSLFLDAHGFAETNRVAYPISLNQETISSQGIGITSKAHFNTPLRLTASL